MIVILFFLFEIVIFDFDLDEPNVYHVFHLLNLKIITDYPRFNIWHETIYVQMVRMQRKLYLICLIRMLHLILLNEMMMFYDAMLHRSCLAVTKIELNRILIHPTLSRQVTLNGHSSSIDPSSKMNS